MADEETTPNEDGAAPEDDVEDLADLLTELYQEEESDPTASSDREPEGAKPPSTDPADASPPKGSESAPPAPRLDTNDPEVRSALDDWYRQRRAAEERDADSTAQLKEVEKLIEDGNYEKIGEMFVEEYKTNKSRKELAEEISKQDLGKTYEQIFSHPVFQNLTQEEQALIDPRTFDGGDREYITFLNRFIGWKEAQKNLDSEVEKRVEERVKASRNATRGQRMTGPTPTAVPPTQTGGAQDDDMSKSGMDLLSEGLHEAYEEMYSKR